jgi:hypothetical protein
MKILFVTTERRAAQTGAQTLQGIAPGCRFIWTQTAESGLRWLEANRDAAAVVIEGDPHSREATAFRERVSQLGLRTRVVVAAPGGMTTAARESTNAEPTPTAAVNAEVPRISPPPEAAAPARVDKLTVALQRRLLDLEAEQAVTADRLARREAEFADALARATASQTTVEQRLGEAIVRAEQARQRAEADLNAAVLREGALKNQVAEVTAARQVLQQNLAAAEAARVDAERRQAGKLAEAQARLSDLQTRYDAVLAIHATARVNLEQQLADADAARKQLASTVEDAARREAVLVERLAAETAARERYERELAAAETQRADAERRTAAELARSAASLADLQRAYDAAAAEHEAERDDFEQQLADADDVRKRLLSEAVAARNREADLTAHLERETAARETTDHQLAAAEAARIEDEHRHAAEAAAAAAKFAERQSAYDAALAEHAAARAVFEEQLADADAARQRLVAEAAAAAEREAALAAALAAETATREAREWQLATAEAERAEADRRHATELARTSAQLANLESAYDAAVVEHTAARTALEQQLAEAASTRQRLTAEAASAAEREAALNEDLAREKTTRVALEQKLAAVEASRAEADREHAIERSEAAARLTELQAAYDAAVADHTAACDALEQRLAEAAAEAQSAAEAHRALQTELDDTRTGAATARRRLLDRALRRRRRTREHIARLVTELGAERNEARRALADRDAELERIRLSLETELARVNGEYDQARQSLDHLGISFAALEQVAAENAADRARLESTLAERDAQLRAHVERHLEAERKARDTIEGLRLELQAARSHASRVQGAADRAPVLQRELEETQRESRRLFERAPYGLCRFMPDGAFIKANHSFARLLGYRKADDIRAVSLGNVFECAADLRWVVDRAAETAATQTTETALNTRDGRRVEVRLHALGHADGTVDVGVQDLTTERVLEARLREAHRMEAVGRLASEVAVTCDKVLRDVADTGRAWLAGIDQDPEIRQQGEMLLGEVTRAAGFLRDFSVYGKKQVSASEPVTVQQIIRNLAPVLKRVAGDDIDWVLPKMSRAVHADVDTERVERVLVNCASYARERMPQGGRIKIEVTTTVVGRDFTAKYPNVRPGAHVLVTIAELKRGTRAESSLEPYAEQSALTDAAESASRKTGVDLGALLALLGNCGGHLWIAAERSGNLTLKVHLPKRMSAEPTADVPTPVQRVRQLAGWFRN